MKRINKKKIILLAGIILIIISILSLYNKQDAKLNESNSNMAIMLEDSFESKTYYESSDVLFPKSGYTYNAEKSYCLNGSKLTWDDTNKKINAIVAGSEKCYIFFDKLPRLVDEILTNNGGATAIEVKGIPDFTKASPEVNYTENDFLSTDSYTNDATSIKWYYTYADSYTFSNETGKYSLVNPKVCQYSSCYASLANKYIQWYQGSSNSTLATYTNLSTIFKIETTTSSALTYRESDKTIHYNMMDKGMYAARDDYGTSYYFRGAVDNNWVKFAGFYWRIVRINGNGSIKLIYSGTTAPTESQKVIMTGIDTQIGTTQFNNSSSQAEYVGYMYSLGETHGVDTPSMIKTYVDTWYENNLTSYSMYLEDSLFCYDRSSYLNKAGTTQGGGTGTTFTYYGSYIRDVTNKAPILTCPNKIDAFTVNDESKGNDILTYPVGLLTADEAIMAGNGNNGYEEFKYYLNTKYTYWLGSPIYFAGTNAAFEYYIDGFNGGTGSYSVRSDNTGVRPVISLKSTVETSGSGQWNDPYVVQTE